MDPQTQRSAVGAFIGLIIIIVAIMSGSVYFWNKRADQNSQDVASTFMQ